MIGSERADGMILNIYCIFAMQSNPEQLGRPAMAQKITVTLEDDLDGGAAAETLQFSFDGTQYEIDLNKKNARAFRKQVAPFIEHARRAGRGQRRQPGRTQPSRRHSSDVRAWAKDQGITVSARGRIPASVVEQYEAAANRS